MTNIYYADSDALRAGIGLKTLSDYFLESDRSRALRYRNEQDGYNFLLGRMLLKWGLRTIGLSDDITGIIYSMEGKPILPTAHFSISHSAKLVGCALNQTDALGLDVEHASPKDITLFRSSFTESEWLLITEATSPLQTFLQLWTRKESIIKALGITLGEMHAIEIDCKSDEFLLGDVTWSLQDLDFGAGFSGALCARTAQMQSRIVAVEALIDMMR